MKAPPTTAGKIHKPVFGISLLAVIAFIYDLGFVQSVAVQQVLYWIYLTTILGGIVSVSFRYVFGKPLPRAGVLWFDGLLALYLLAIFLHHAGLLPIAALDGAAWLHISVFLVFIRELSALNIEYRRSYFNPAQLFIASFLVIIIIGTLLLLLPNATHSGISWLDALFTSTSAVCVTGLIVVDTGTYFTRFGQSIILLLIQTGGIGIMTFTSYFSYFFRGGSSYENQLFLKDMTNAEKIGEVFNTLKKIILLTFLIEGAGAAIIFLSLDKSTLPLGVSKLFFSIFHSLSAFCNAGFSILTNGLYEVEFRFNYPLQLIICGLFIIGGLGFPIAFNFYRYVRHVFTNRLFSRKMEYIPWVMNISTRIVLITTAILLVSGTALFYLFEYDNTLAEHNGFGKLVTAFFGAATPRTAGFNSVDTSALNLATLMIVFLFMWIGASPGSTGGGIKTTTIAVATLNFFSLARGKDRIEVFHREISGQSVRRTLAVISLSLIAIGCAVFLIAIFDPEKELLSIAFESFSAYSTVGLSLGITGSLNDQSKLVIIATMFIGRVSMLTILVAIFRNIEFSKYRYPSEDILIN